MQANASEVIRDPTHHVKKTILLFLGLALEQGPLNAVHDLGANLLRIWNLLQEASVLLDTRNTYFINPRLALRTHQASSDSPNWPFKLRRS